MAKRGLALIFALVTVLIVAILAIVVLSSIASHARLTNNIINRTRAYYAALAGMNLAVEKLRTGAWGNNTNTTTYHLCKSNCTEPPDVIDYDISYNMTITIGALGSAPDLVGRIINITTDQYTTD
ncbi:MAG: hypothetical protein ABIH75_01115 [Candidatus Omnitrophota bacterium]